MGPVPFTAQKLSHLKITPKCYSKNPCLRKPAGRVQHKTEKEDQQTCIIQVHTLIDDKHSPGNDMTDLLSCPSLLHEGHILVRPVTTEHNVF